MGFPEAIVRTGVQASGRRQRGGQPRWRGALASAVMAASLLSWGCGYALIGRASNIPPEIQSVYLDPIENLTPRPEIEQIIGQALASELVTRKRFTLSSSRDGAQAAISGTVISFAVTPLTFDTEGRASEYEITITLKAAFQNLLDETVLWSNDRYIFKETYPVDPSADTYFDRERIAIEEASEKFAETLVTDLLEGF